MKKKNLLSVLLAIIVWVCIFIFPFLFFPYKRDQSAFESERFVHWLIYCSVYLMIFYFANSTIFIPKILAKKKFLTYVLIIEGCFLLYLFFFHLITINAEETKQYFERQRQRALERGRPHRPLGFWERFFMPSTVALFLITYLFSTISKIISQWFLAEERKEEMQKQQLATELNMLRSQVNPHFLFNTLNGIYSMAVAKDEKTPDSVMKLSRIMRYTLEESQTEKVALAKEIEFINSYIELQKLRANDKLHVDFEVKGNVEHVQIAPLLFIPFIENAFKYGISAHSDVYIKMGIAYNEGKLYFTCSNPVFPNQKIKTGTGTGISNVKRRLELLYENRHELKINKKEEVFFVDLYIQLK